jgi:DNA modification methylase
LFIEKEMAEEAIALNHETVPKQDLRYPTDLLNKIICGDSLGLIKIIPDREIDCILTDPPYGLNKNGIKNDSDLSLFYNILPDCYRVLKDDSFFITFFSTKYLPELFKNNPFTYFWQFVLYCPEGSVRSPIGWTKYMSCVVFKKGQPKLAKRKTDIFKDTPGKMVEPDEGFIDHPTPKPKHFVREILEMATKEKDIILDPFIGSGSTAVACKQRNRRFIGFEINREYCLLANKRLLKF